MCINDIVSCSQTTISEMDDSRSTSIVLIMGNYVSQAYNCLSKKSTLYWDEALQMDKQSNCAVLWPLSPKIHSRSRLSFTVCKSNVSELTLHLITMDPFFAVCRNPGRKWIRSKFLHLAPQTLSCHISLDTCPFCLIIGLFWTVCNARDAPHFKHQNRLLFQFAGKLGATTLIPSGSQEQGQEETRGDL